ncbi:MAG: leucyl aminopeptidase [Nocardioidaceae bacterium]|nr:leucyl aminopeptidase [Nocardioidaceae bacterium]
MLTLSARSAKPSSVRTDAVVVGIVRTSKGMVAVDAAVDVAKAFGRGFVPTLSSLGFEAEPGQVAKLPSSGAVKPALVVAVGLGAADEVDREGLRRAAAAGVQAVANAVSVALALPVDGPDDVQAVGEGALLGLYSYDAYRSAEPDRRPTDVVVLCEKARRREVKRAVETAETVAGAVAMARDWVNAPPNDLNPVTFAEQISAHKSAGKVKVTVLDDKDLTKQGCGGILGVGQGSSNPPRLVQLTYAPRRPAARIALVGKGITFDSGGLSLKPGASMMTMKCDMGGAAAVVAATFAIAELGLPVAITAYAALAENMPSGTASRPGDVLTMRSGKTVEVLNTDAEGRLVLADALDMAVEGEPDLVVDVATLTGACIVALGTRVAGVLSNDESLLHRMPEVAERAGEAMWPLPIPDEVAAKVKTSSMADLRQHNPEPHGGTLFAAAFLREFVKESRWVHLDIAGPAYNDGQAHGYTPKGGTGAAVRTLVRLAHEAASDGLLSTS